MYVLVWSRYRTRYRLRCFCDCPHETTFAQLDGITTNASSISAIFSFASHVKDLLLQHGSTADSSFHSDSPVENTNQNTSPTAKPPTKEHMLPVYTYFAYGDE
jgi:hypothetical protein